MPQAAWEALLRDAVQGLRPPHTPATLRRWPQTTHPHAWAICAPQPPPPKPTTPHREGKGQGHRKGKGRERTARQGGEERPKVAGRHPQGQSTGGDTTQGQETIKEPGTGRTRGRGTEGEGATTGTRAHTQERHATTGRTSTAPPPAAGGARPPRRAAEPPTRGRTNRTSSRHQTTRPRKGEGGHTHT